MIDIDSILSTVTNSSCHSALLRYSGWFLLAYLVGALPIGFWIARRAGVNDITRHGSGTMGATNVARTLGASFFFLVFCIDAGKAALMLYCMPEFFWTAGIIGLMLGNTRSLFLRGGGGKGVATLVGILAIMNSTLLLLFLVVWITVLLLLRSVGKASVCALAVLLLFISLTIPLSPAYAVLGVVLAWSLYCHCKHVAALSAVCKVDSKKAVALLTLCALIGAVFWYLQKSL